MAGGGRNTARAEEAPTVETEMMEGESAGNDNNNNNNRRLIISKLTLENFKSYAGKKVIGPFHKCFSSIVGPN